MNDLYEMAQLAKYAAVEDAYAQGVEDAQASMLSEYGPSVAAGAGIGAGLGGLGIMGHHAYGQTAGVEGFMPRAKAMGGHMWGDTTSAAKKAWGGVSRGAKGAYNAVKGTGRYGMVGTGAALAGGIGGGLYNHYMTPEEAALEDAIITKEAAYQVYADARDSMEYAAAVYNEADYVEKVASSPDWDDYAIAAGAGAGAGAAGYLGAIGLSSHLLNKPKNAPYRAVMDAAGMPTKFKDIVRASGFKPPLAWAGAGAAAGLAGLGAYALYNRDGVPVTGPEAGTYNM